MCVSGGLSGISLSFSHLNMDTACKVIIMTSEQTLKLLRMLLNYFILFAPVAQSVECPLRGTRGHRFDPGLRHTKVVKMVLEAPHLALRLMG